MTFDSFSLNDADVVSGVVVGNQINDLNISAVQMAGYTEKAAIKEGLDASDIYSAARIVKMIGQTSDATAAKTYDRLQDVLAALSPTASFLADEANEGYLALEGQVPTEDTGFSLDGDGLRWVPLVIYCRPKNPPGYDLNRDRVGGPDTGLALPWQIVLEAKDPRVYINDERIITLAGTSGTGTLVNRGRYPTPVSVDVLVKANQTASTFTLTFPNFTMTISLPNNAATQEFWYDGTRHVLYRKIGTGVFEKAMSLLTLTDLATALPEGGSYSWSVNHDVLATTGSTFSYFEAWA